LSEESGSIDQKSAYLWLIDPLDGSFNYQHGRESFGVMIGLVVDGAPVISVIYLPVHDELFVAIQGYGATRNGKRITVSSTESLPEAVIHFGDFAKDDVGSRNTQRLADITKLAYAVGRVRMVGSAAVDAADVACGRADGLIVRNLHIWDTIIGQLLVQEANGKVTVHHDQTDGRQLIFSNKHVHPTLEALLSD
jgi:myo-inositol-1(or 4)-monophosphatase